MTVCLRVQGIDEGNGGDGRISRDSRLSNNDRGVGRRRGIYNTSEGSETTTEAARIQGRQWRLPHRNDRPEELATTAEALAEKDEPEDLMMTTEASA